MSRYLAACLVALTLLSLIPDPARATSSYTLITILHTNDMHGSVMPAGGEGGLARAATLIRQIRSQMPNVLLLDAGDIIHGTPEDYLSGGMATISAMNAAGYQLATTGNHEFDFGLPVIQAATASASFPFVAANIHAASGGQWDRIAPYAILDIGGVKVGVLGLTTLETITLHWPNAIRDIVIEDPIATALSRVPQLRAQSDVLVVLSHLGDKQDALLAETVPGIDFIVGGHSHTVISDWRWVGNTLITQAGAYARALGRIDFIVRKDESGAQIMSVNGRPGTNWSTMARPPLGARYPTLPLIPVDNTIAEDEAVRAAYLPYREEADRRLSEVIGTAVGRVSGSDNAAPAFPGRSTGADESAAGDLVADAIRSFARSDVALIDANSVAAGGLAAGPVTVRSAFELIGGYTRQHLVVARVSGAGIRTALDKGFERKKAINAAVSGATIDYRIQDGVPVVDDLLIGGQPVDPQRKYTVVAQAYVMMDLMQVVPDVEVISEPSETTREALVSYIRKLGTLTPGPLDRVRRKQ